MEKEKLESKYIHEQTEEESEQLTHCSVIIDFEDLVKKPVCNEIPS